MSQQILITWDAIFAVAFSLTIFSYAILFNNKKKSIMMHVVLFLPFLIYPVLDLLSHAEISTTLSLSAAFFFFFLFSSVTYKDFDEKNKESYYFFMIVFFFFVTGSMFSFVNYPDFLQDNNILFYAAFSTCLLAIVVHIIKASEQKKMLLSYMAAGLFLLISQFFKEDIAVYVKMVLLSSFFILNLICIRERLYVPLLKRIDKMQKQLDKREIDMPEHIREKFQILEHNRAKLMDMAHKDKMTGIMNKGKMLSTIKELIDDSKVTLFSVLMFDIDNFKQINDNLGHLIGDECIIELARIGENSIRKNDFIARYGGDEFIIILQGIDAISARVIADRFRINVKEKTDPAFSISIGIASYPEDGKTVKQLIQSADQSLYLSKERGRDKVSHVSRY